MSLLAEVEALIAADAERPDWATITQTGPDGTTPIALVAFRICPVCKGPQVPTLGLADQSEYFTAHLDWHRDQARITDEIAGSLRLMTDAVLNHRHQLPREGA